jgi:arabinan endo-1,5-alpha-L-arabinosidase
MVFGSFWQNLFLADMDSIPTKNSGREKQIAYQPAGEHAIEAGFIYEHKGTWYLFFSAGKCCYLDNNRPAKGKEYQIMACRSRSPTGPYEDLYGKDCSQGGGTTILPSHDWVFAPGGQGVFDDKIEGTVIYYSYGKWRRHCELIRLILTGIVDTRAGYSDAQKKFGWNKLVFRDSWPYVE